MRGSFSVFIDPSGGKLVVGEVISTMEGLTFKPSSNDGDEASPTVVDEGGTVVGVFTTSSVDGNT